MAIVAQERNSALIQILSPDYLPLLDRNHFIDLYGSVADTGIVSATTLSLETVRFVTAPSFYTLDSNILTILQDGLYRLDYWATFGFDGGFTSDPLALLWLEEDPATGVFAEVPGSRIYYNLPFAEGVSGQRSISLRVPANYRYRLRAQRLGGSNTLRTFATQKGMTATCLLAVK